MRSPAAYAPLQSHVEVPKLGNVDLAEFQERVLAAQTTPREMPYRCMFPGCREAYVDNTGLSKHWFKHFPKGSDPAFSTAARFQSVLDAAKKARQLPDGWTDLFPDRTASPQDVIREFARDVKKIGLGVEDIRSTAQSIDSKVDTVLERTDLILSKSLNSNKRLSDMQEEFFDAKKRIRSICRAR